MPFDLKKLADVDSSLLKLLTQHLPDMLWIKDLDGVYIYANQAICDGLLMANSIDEPIGKDDLFFALRERELHKDNPDWHTFGELCFNSDKVVIDSNKAMKFEEYGNIKGELLYLEVNKAPFYDNDGNIIGTVGSGRDITELKMTQLKLEKQTQINTNQAHHVTMGEMIGNIAHQWRQPLSVISSGATGLMMQKEYDILSDDEFYDTCNAINNNAQYLSKTIDDFKDFIKGDSKVVNFDLKKDTESFLKIVESTIKNNFIDIILDLKENIRIEGYPNQLIQCFINIYNNAKDALVENIKDSDRYIFITQEQVNDSVIIKFKDSAGGVPKDILDKIFDPYFTTKSEEKGTGLGLSMTYNLITNGMKGNIEAINTDFQYNGKSYTGAQFTITLPLG
ncbi:MAG: PAS domain-containing sensor histidine kinase [Campylobacterota bacterium]|nr:PAS domain-containing sensor histidine kinase [Campylobacterota bacterium]